MSALSARAIVVMGRIPGPGRVKTRIARRIGDDRAAELYRAFLLDVFDAVERAAGEVDAKRVFSCALGPGEHLGDARGLAPAGWQAVPQVGAGLGERIEDARRRADALHTLILGSDSPTMAPARMLEAFACLDEGVDAVFGPTRDGGYDLAGFH